MSKGLLKNYTFNTAAKTITLNDVGAVRLDKLALVTDVTTNKILYNFADSTVSLATVAGNVITLSALQGGESNTDKLRIDYDVEAVDINASNDTAQPVTFAQNSNPLPVSMVGGITLGTPDGTPVTMMMAAGDGTPLDTRGGGLRVSVDNISNAVDGSIMTSGSFLDVPFSIYSATTGPFPRVDTSTYKYVSIQISATTGAGILVFEGSNTGNVNDWSGMPMMFSSSSQPTAVITPSPTGVVLIAGTTLILNVPLYTKYFRLRASAVTLATAPIMGVMQFYTEAPPVGFVGTSTNLSYINNLQIPTFSSTAIAAGAMPSVTYGILNEGTFSPNGLPLTFPTKGTEASASTLRMSTNRNLYQTIRDAQGNERGVYVTPDNKLKVQDSEDFGINEQNSGLLQGILDAILLLPTSVPVTDSRQKRVVSVPGADVSSIVTAPQLVLTTTTPTTL